HLYSRLSGRQEKRLPREHAGTAMPVPHPLGTSRMGNAATAQRDLYRGHHIPASAEYSMVRSSGPPSQASTSFDMAARRTGHVLVTGNRRDQAMPACQDQGSQPMARATTV